GDGLQSCASLAMAMPRQRTVNTFRRFGQSHLRLCYATPQGWTIRHGCDGCAPGFDSRRHLLQPDAGHQGAVEHMDRVDEEEGAGLSAHDQRVGAGATGEVLDALQQVAARDAAGREDDVLAAGEVVRAVDAIQVDTHGDGALRFRVVAGAETSEDLAA